MLLLVQCICLTTFISGLFYLYIEDLSPTIGQSCQLIVKCCHSVCLETRRLMASSFSSDLSIFPAKDVARAKRWPKVSNTLSETSQEIVTFD